VLANGLSGHGEQGERAAERVSGQKKQWPVDFGERCEKELRI
jgi:hypothetical protein